MKAGFYTLASPHDPGVMVTPDGELAPAVFMYPGAARAKARRVAKQKDQCTGKSYRSHGWERGVRQMAS